jgi:hypothetical protein
MCDRGHRVRRAHRQIIREATAPVAITAMPPTASEGLGVDSREWRGRAIPDRPEDWTFRPFGWVELRPPVQR